MIITNKVLAEKIDSFLIKYAKKMSDGEYTSPDAYQLEDCATLLKLNKKLISMPWSEWGSGGYHPYTSKEGKKEHDEILLEIKRFVNR